MTQGNYCNGKLCNCNSWSDTYANNEVCAVVMTGDGETIDVQGF